jgi:hypothetical protein
LSAELGTADDEGHIAVGNPKEWRRAEDSTEEKCEKVQRQLQNTQARSEHGGKDAGEQWDDTRHKEQR